MRAWIELLAGGGFLYFGAEWLVRGAAGLALSLGVAQLVIGLTVVAYGTSAPELVVGIEAATRGDSAIALGNVIGSNIANLGLILGVVAVLRPPRIDADLRGRELPVLAVATLALAYTVADGAVSRSEGGALLAGALAYSAWMLRGVRRARAQVDLRASEAAATVAAGSGAIVDEPRPSRARLLLLSVVGLALLVAGGHAFVSGARSLALSLGVSSRMIGLTVVALGTSMPELAASVIAAWRGHADLAVGNVIGSNVFNVLLVLGATALIHPVAVAPEARIDALVTLGLTALAIVFITTSRTLSRWEGAVLLVAYAAYIAYLGQQAF